MGFKKLTNEQWSKIQPYLSKRADVGKPRANNRTTINGMMCEATTGCAWMDMPEQYRSVNDTQKIPRYARKRNLGNTFQKHNQISIQTKKV